uniref:CPBP family intramembrane metalloprotease n=1 Tax=Eiseniibacteriota bacterium TaxID=2212470 RepID=A0A832I3J6_UNCEI
MRTEDHGGGPARGPEAEGSAGHDAPATPSAGGPAAPPGARDARHGGDRDAGGAGDPASEDASPSPADEAPGEPSADAPRALDEQGLLGWLLAIALLGIGGVALGEQELAGLMALAGLFVAAQAADTEPRWAPLYAAVGWIVPAGSIAVFGGLAVMLQQNLPPGPLRAGLIGFAAAAALVCLALAFGPAARAATAALFRGSGERRDERTAARLVLAGLMLGLPGWFALREPIREMLAGPDSLLAGHSFLGGLIGYIAVAFAAAGYGLRRTAAEAVARLGLRPLAWADGIWIVAGLGALWAVNAGAEHLQRGYFPALYEQDRRFGEVLAGGLAAWQIVLLSLNAGVGEEITLRGALQPRLGIALSAAFFAALHVQYSWFGMLVIFALGVVLGMLRRRTSTTVAIAVHTLYDLLALFTM